MRPSLAPVLAVAFSASLIATSARPAVAATAADAQFVIRAGPALTLAGQPYRFSGFNIYQAAIRTGWGTGGCSPVTTTDLDAMLDAAGPGNTVIRFWAFQNLSIKGGQLDLAPLRSVLAEARSRGVRVIPVLTNEWADCESSARKTDDWYGSIAADGTVAPGRYRSEIASGTVEPYYDWVRDVVTAFRDDPTVLAWELVNEPEVGAGGECWVNSAAILRAFAADVSSLVKGIDRNHLVSLGTLGGPQCGTQLGLYSTIHDVAGLDLCSIHVYSEADASNEIADRLNRCAQLNKTAFLGEVGLSFANLPTGSTTTDRAAVFNRILGAAFRLRQTGGELAGALGWALVPAYAGTPKTFDIMAGDPSIATFRTHGGGCAPGAGLEWPATLPASIAAGGWTDNCRLRVLAERSGVTLGGDLPLDLASGRRVIVSTDLTGGSLPSGTVVDSYLLHADRVGTGTTPIPYFGSVTFDADVLGVQVRSATLATGERAPTDLRATGVTYGTGDSLRGLELEDDPQSPMPVPGAGDQFILSDRTLSFRFLVTNALDEVRVLTAPAPGAPDLALTGSRDREVVPAGDPVSVSLQVVNRGTRIARDARVSGALPADLAYTGTDPRCSAAGSSLSCVLFDVAPGASTSLVLGFRASDTLPSGPAPLVFSADTAGDADAANDSVTFGGSVCRAIDRLGTSGPAYGYGDGRLGSFGDGTTADHDQDVAPVTPGRQWAAVSSGEFFMLGLSPTGTVWGWGDNSAAQYMGRAGADDITSPREVPGVTEAVTITAGAVASFAIRCDGTLIGWGSPAYYANGTAWNDGDPLVTPVVTPDLRVLPPIVQVAAGSSNAVALDATGAVWAWGANGSGQLGQGTTSPGDSRALRVALPGPAVWVSAGNGSALAVLADGRVLAWGADNGGQLGDGQGGPGRYNATPTVISGLPPTDRADLGDRSGVAVDHEGHVWAWGPPNLAIGAGESVDVYLPATAVDGPADVAAVHAFDQGTAVIDGAGRLWTWGPHSGRAGVEPIGVVPGITNARGLDGYSNPVIIAALDTTPPTGSITVADPAAADPARFALGRQVTVRATATDDTGGVVSVRLANTSALTDGLLADGTTVPFAREIPWTLAAGPDGPRSVYAQFVDATGNWSQPVQASTTIDTAAPFGSLRFPALESPSGTCTLVCATGSTSVRLGTAAIDSTSGASLMRISSSDRLDAGGLLDVPSRPYQAEWDPWTLDGADGRKTVWIQWRDGAGNWSAPVARDVWLDRVAPAASAPTIAFSVGSRLTTGSPPIAEIDVTWSGTDDPAGTPPGTGSGILRWDLDHTTAAPPTTGWTAEAGTPYRYPSLPNPLGIFHRPTSIGTTRPHTFRVRPTDAVTLPAPNVGAYASGLTFVIAPVDNGALTTYAPKAWQKPLTMSGAYGGTVTRSQLTKSGEQWVDCGCGSGMALGLVARRVAGGTTVRVSVDGGPAESVTLDGTLRVAWSWKAPPGTSPTAKHTVRLTVPSDTQIDLDAFLVGRVK